MHITMSDVNKWCYIVYNAILTSSNYKLSINRLSSHALPSGETHDKCSHTRKTSM